MTIEQRIYDGDRAREVLENEAFSAVFSDIESELTNAWKSSPQRDAEGRERLFLALTMLGKIKASLVTRLETGKLAALDLEHHRSISERLKDARQALFTA